MATYRGEDFKFPDEVDKATEQEVEIEIEDDTPPEDRNRKPMDEPPQDFQADELAKYDESVRKRIQHFTKGYHEERRKAEAAQREREEAIRAAQVIAEENKKLKGSLSESQTALIESAKRVVNTEIEEAKSKYKNAYEAGDSEALLAAQEELTAAKIKADKVNNFKPTPLQDSKNEVQTAQAAPTTVVDPKAEAWREKNPWFGNDDEMTSFALGYHAKLLKSGVNPSSEEYYEKLNSRLKQVFPDAFESEKPADAPPPQRPAKSNVAPATRSTAPKKIVLTQTQVNIAKRLGVPLELYAKKVAEEQVRSN